MLRIDDATIEKISDDIVCLIRQGRYLKDTAEEGDGWQGKDNLEILWHDYIKRVDPHEKEYIVIINSMLTKQAKEVFDKIKKYPNSYKKWMFDRKKWLREFAGAEAKFITKLIKQEGQKAIDLALKLLRKSYYKAEEIPITIAFDVYNPEVTDELLKQTTKFPAGVVGTSEEIIRREIANGLELGESIDKLRKRVTGRLGPTYIKNRAEMIARSETIYASNAGAELGYMQSGVVEGKKWLTALDERTCFLCTDMNNMTAPLGQPTWEKEGLNIGDVQGKYGLDFDYTEGAMPHPPLHPRCRCTIVPILERITAPSRLEETLQNGKVTSSVGLGEAQGANMSTKIHIKGDGDACFKPIIGENISIMNQMKGSSGNLAMREKWAYKISKSYGIDNVPITVMRKVKGKLGSVQLWDEVGNVASGYKYSDLRKIYEKYAIQKERAKMEIFDWMIGNWDRHAGNYLIKGSKLVYIDNGACLPYLTDPNFKKYFRNTIDMATKVTQVTPKVVLTKPEIKDVMKRIRNVHDSKVIATEMYKEGKIVSEYYTMKDRCRTMIEIMGEFL